MYIRTLAPSDAESYRELRLQSLQQHPEAFLSSYESEAKLSIETTRIRLDSSDEHFTLVKLHRPWLCAVADESKGFVEPFGRQIT
ncbi:hypothetical protein J2Z70_000442 [Paenibacillus silagei]|uniref:GNAT family N-acetyltransferase n=1 Tax=Paenibacillus silagei TaxID=1670801 RepID=A0ABS4NJT4_9BACL|nr:hypothetical protein [Paenibacillus silagei]